MIRRGRPKEYLIMEEPFKMQFKKKIFLIKEKIKVPIKALANGGARISISKDYDNHQAIVFIIEREVKK